MVELRWLETITGAGTPATFSHKVLQYRTGTSQGEWPYDWTDWSEWNDVPTVTIPTPSEGRE